MAWVGCLQVSHSPCDDQALRSGLYINNQLINPCGFAIQLLKRVTILLGLALYPCVCFGSNKFLVPLSETFSWQLVIFQKLICFAVLTTLDLCYVFVVGIQFDPLVDQEPYF